MVLLQRAALQRGHFPAELAMEMVVMRDIGPLVPGGATGKHNSLYTTFLHKLADRPVHGGNPKPRAGALGMPEHFLRGEYAVHAIDGGNNGRSLLSLSFRC